MNVFDRPKRKLFNVAGPCNERDHYMLPALERLPEVVDLICDRQYFLIHAARQSGKTTALKYLTRCINQSSTQCALYCTLESVQQVTDHDTALRAIAALILRTSAKARLISLNDDEISRLTESGNVVYKVSEALQILSESVKKDVVVFFDEVDCLPETVLVSFLRQLRDGYVNRDTIPFPSSLALVGMRRIQDFKVKVRDESKSLGTASPFNVTKKNLTLRNFTRENVVDLYKQHTDATGQEFEEGVYDEVMFYTGGQPWLVNAIASDCVERIHHHNYSELITVEDVRTAKETIIRRRDHHILSLLARLEEPRVMRIVEAVIIGEQRTFAYDSPDCEYVLDLGILKIENGRLVPSNKMYTEMISRYFTWDWQNDFRDTMREVPWIKSDGLDMNRLVKDFQAFWRKNAGAWKDVESFREAGPHILFMAFLQRVVNGRGRVTREMALGSHKLDIGLEFMGRNYAVEIKLKKRYDREANLEQVNKYLNIMNAPEGWLLVFDSMPTEETSNWDERLTWEDVPVGDRVVHIVGF